MRKLAGLVLLVLLGLYIASAVNGDKPSGSSVGPTVAPPELVAAGRALANFHMSKPAWRKGGFGIVAVADFTFANDNSVAVRDVTIGCTFYGASGTQLGTGEQTIYQTFPAKKSTVVREVNLGFINSQSATASCAVDKVVPLGDPTFDDFYARKPPAEAAPTAQPNPRPAALPVRP